jgi:hypothetical protein
MPDHAEPFLAPSALADALNSAEIRGPGGHAWTPRAAREVVRALRAAGLPYVRGKYVRLSDAAGLIATGWKPFSNLHHENRS